MRIKKALKKLLLRYKMIKQHPVSSQEPVKAFCRYMKFNIIQTLCPKKRIYNWVYGLKFIATKGDAGIVGNIYYKLMDYEESMFLINHLSENELFVDVGANLGQFTLLACGVSKAKAIAIEPIPNTLKDLIKNITINQLEDRVRVVNCGVSDKKEVLNFTTNRSVMNTVALKASEHTIQLQVDTLDNILENENPVFIKIDVEGFELNVLKGAFKILKKKSLLYLMIEFNNSGLKFGFKDDDVYQLLLSYQFVPVAYDVDNKKIKPLTYYNTHKFNTLFIRKSNLN